LFSNIGRRRSPEKLYDVVSGKVDGNDVSYSFSKPVSAERAQEEFRKAVKQGLPSGSVILIFEI
jgi:hypothetical protein